MKFLIYSTLNYLEIIINHAMEINYYFSVCSVCVSGMFSVLVNFIVATKCN